MQREADTFEKKIKKMSRYERQLLDLVTEYYERNLVMKMSKETLSSMIFISIDRIKFIINLLNIKNFINVKLLADGKISMDLSVDFQEFKNNNNETKTHGTY